MSRRAVWAVIARGKLCTKILKNLSKFFTIPILPKTYPFYPSRPYQRHILLPLPQESGIEKLPFDNHFFGTNYQRASVVAWFPVEPNWTFRVPETQGGTQHIRIQYGVSPRNFHATQKYHFSFIATPKYQLIFYLEICT